MGGLVTRLQNLVQVSLDPAAPLYVLRNLKTPQDHCGSRIVMETHKLAIIRLLTLRSKSPDDELVALLFQAAIPRLPGEPRVPLVGLPNNPLKNLLEKGNGLPMMIAKEQMQKELLIQQIEALR